MTANNICNCQLLLLLFLGEERTARVVKMFRIVSNVVPKLVQRNFRNSLMLPLNECYTLRRMCAPVDIFRGDALNSQTYIAAAAAFVLVVYRRRDEEEPFQLCMQDITLPFASWNTHRSRITLSTRLVPLPVKGEEVGLESVHLRILSFINCVN